MLRIIRHEQEKEWLHVVLSRIRKKRHASNEFNTDVIHRYIDDCDCWTSENRKKQLHTLTDGSVAHHGNIAFFRCHFRLLSKLRSAFVCRRDLIFFQSVDVVVAALTNVHIVVHQSILVTTQKTLHLKLI